MQSVIDFVVSHQAIFAGLFVAVLDFVFAVSPKVESNGVLHGIYVFFKNMLNKTQAPLA